MLVARTVVCPTTKALRNALVASVCISTKSNDGRMGADTCLDDGANVNESVDEGYDGPG